MKDFGSSDVSDDMVLGKDENLFCVADAQATIERLDLEPKITAYRSMKVIEVQYYLLCQCSTTPIAHEVLLLFLTSPSIMEGGGPISVLSLAFFSVSDEEDSQ